MRAMPCGVSVISAFFMCLHGLGTAVSRLFRCARKSHSPSDDYAAICDETEHQNQSDPSTEASQLKKSGKRKARTGGNSELRKQSLTYSRRNDEVSTGKPGNAFRPPRPDLPNFGNNRGATDAGPKPLGDGVRPPRPDLPSFGNNRGATDAGPKPLGDGVRPPRPDLPSFGNNRGATNAGPKPLGDGVRPPRPNPPSNVAVRKLSESRRNQLGNMFRPQRPDMPFGVAGRGVNDAATKLTGGCLGIMTKGSDNGPNNQTGSVKNPANIKLPKRRASLQDHQKSKLRAGEGLAPTLFPLFAKPKKNATTTEPGKPILEHSQSAESCLYSSVKFEEFFN